MLDSSEGVLCPADPVLLSEAYSLIGDKGKITDFLALVARRFDADAVRLLRAGRGESVELAVFGTPGADETRVDGALQVDGRHLALAFCGARPLGAEDTESLQSLLIHIDRAVSLSAKLEAFEVERALGSQLLDRMAVGTVFLDKSRQIVTTTGTAQAMIRAGDGLRVRGGCLVATDSADDRVLQAELRAVLSGGAPASTDVLRLSLPQSKRTIGLVVRPVDTDRALGGIACAVIIRDGDRMCGPQIDMLRRYFDLTAAEAMLTSNLAGGLTLDEAAESLNIRRNTARAHLRAIFSKCGVKRQTELIRLVLASVAMLGMGEITPDLIG